MFFNSDLKTKKRGFTLAELLVVMAIATILTTILVVQQNSWNDQLTVNTQAYELALMVRQAQIYSLGVKVDPLGQNDKFNVSYGVYFNNNNTQYIFFADRDGDQKYDSGEALETKSFNRGVNIKDVCGDDRCIFSGGGPLRQASVSFLRPETQAYIKLLNDGGNPVDVPPLSIYLQSVKGKVYLVKVETNGQISITPQ